MSQLNLFRPVPAVAEASSNPEFVRRHLHRLLELARRAERLPWSAPDATKWADLFPQLAASLPSEEGQSLAQDFALELERLKAA